MFNFVANDTLPTIFGTLTEDDGTTPVNLSGYTITLHIAYSPPLVKAATIISEAGGEFGFYWLNTTSSPTPANPPDLRAGTWSAEIQIISPEGTKTVQNSIAGSPLRFVVAAEIA